MKKVRNNRNTAMKIGAGVLAAGAAAAAGYYFYGSKNAKGHRKIASKWATDMKKEIVRETKRLKNASPEAFAAVVDRVAKSYRIARSVDTADLKRATKELKANWKMVQREAARVRKGVSRAKAKVKRVK